MQCLADSVSDSGRIVRTGAGAAFRLCEVVASSKFHKLFQCSNAFCAGSRQVYLIRCQCCVHDHLIPRTRNRNIEPSPSALSVERPEVHGHFAILVRPVAYGEENDITLITLYVLQILDKQRFLRVVGPVFQLSVILACFRQKVINQILLRDVEGHHTNASLGTGRIVAAALQFSDDGLCFSSVGSLATALKDAVHMDEMYVGLSVVH